jgi:hypothetical protein
MGLPEFQFNKIPAGMYPQFEGFRPGMIALAIQGQQVPDLCKFQLHLCRFREKLHALILVNAQWGANFGYSLHIVRL